jgi:hypothetical protein
MGSETDIPALPDPPAPSRTTPPAVTVHQLDRADHGGEVKILYLINITKRQNHGEIKIRNIASKARFNSIPRP